MELPVYIELFSRIVFCNLANMFLSLSLNIIIQTKVQTKFIHKDRYFHRNNNSLNASRIGRPEIRRRVIQVSVAPSDGLRD